MKTIKILTVVAMVAALGFGVYKVFKGDTPTESITGTGQIITDPSSDCNLDWKQQYIDSVYRAVPDRNFKALQERRAEMQDSFDSVMSGSSEICIKNVKQMLSNGYQSRLIEMAHSEFDDADWPNCSKIKTMSSELLSELRNDIDELRQIDSAWSPNTAALDSIIEICDEYQKVVNYNASVGRQSSQTPGSFRSSWDFYNTKYLINNTPMASDPVTHTTKYAFSRRNDVIKRLYRGHVGFLNQLVRLAGREIQHNPTRDCYNNVREVVSKEIQKFEDSAGGLYGSYGAFRQEAKELYRKLDDYKKYIKD